MIELFDASEDSAGILCLVGFILYCLTFLLMGFVWSKFMGFYRGSGGTEKTKETVDNASKAAKAAQKVGV